MMMTIAEMVLMGALATLIMDVLGSALIRLKVIRQPIGPRAVGRWFLYLLKGKLVHADISETPALKYEEQAALVSHYLIGIGLAGVYLFVEFLAPAAREVIWLPLVFGLATVVLPWFWLYPSIGLGFMASRTPNRGTYVATSLVNHTNFGLGLALWVAVFRSSLV